MGKDRIHVWLLDWGDEMRRQYDAHSYPSRSIMLAAFEVPGQIVTEHRIICRDMPARVWPVHRAVVRLEPILQRAIFGKFALPLKSGGLVYTEREVADILCIPKSTLRHRVYRAKTVLRKTLNFTVFGVPTGPSKIQLSQ